MNIPSSLLAAPWLLVLVLVLPLAQPPAAAHGSGTAHQAAPERRAEQQPWGIAGHRRPGQRVVEVSMGDDMRFRPARLTVRLGETVRFKVRNRGSQMHEFVIGSRAALDAHAALMLKFPGMEHDEPYMAHVAPGRSGEIVWTFNRAGEFDFACLIAGHYQAGMVGRIDVLAAAPVRRP